MTDPLAESAAPESVPQASDPTRDERSEPSSIRARVAAFRASHQRAELLALFAAGFLFDARMLRRIDDSLMLLQQGLYLVVVGLLLALDLYVHAAGRAPPTFLRKHWHLGEHLMHFMMGTLLNAFALFYFKSGTGLSALLFAVLIAALLLANEHAAFRKLGPVVLVALYSFCLTSYFAYLIPVLVGTLSAWMFALAAAIATLPLVLLAWMALRWTGDRALAQRQVVIPAAAVQLALLVLFFLRLIPPVPLSVEKMGIYHRVARDPAGHGYLLAHQAVPVWAFWRKGDQEFSARPGDRLYCFVRIFAPHNFREQVFIRYAFDDPKRGWVPSTAIPLTISGGRDDGYGGYAYKSHYEPGRWRVTVELADGREIGSLRIQVREDAGTAPRSFVEDKG